MLCQPHQEIKYNWLFIFTCFEQNNVFYKDKISYLVYSLKTNKIWLMFLSF